jgi:hypothetical protein
MMPDFARGFTILAIDPGLTGAIAFYAPSAPDIITVEDMPVAAKDVDPAALARRIRQLNPNVAIVERVSAMPGQGVSSMFKFGCGYGMVQGVIAALGIEIRFVTPQSWKKHFRLSSDKELSRARAIQAWPASDRFTRKKDSGRAEAALIARFAAESGLVLPTAKVPA